MIKAFKNSLSFFMCILFGLGGCSQPDPQLKKMVLNGATLIDVRTTEEFSKGSAEGAINIPLNQVENRIDEFNNKTDIILFCRSGNRSGKALKILNNRGFTNVTNGGTWKAIKNIQNSKNED